MISSPTLHRAKPLTRNLRRRECRRLERERQRCDVFNRWRCGEKKAKTFGKVSPGTSQGNCESWRGSGPREFVLLRESVSGSRNRSKVQTASRTVPQFCGRGKTGGRRGNRAVLEHELQPRTTSERWRGPAGESSVLPTSERKGVGTKKLARSWSSERLEKEGSDTTKTAIIKNDLVRSLLGDSEKQEALDGHPCPDDDRDVLPTWRTLAVDAGGLYRTNAPCGKRLVTAPALRSTRRAEQTAELRRHGRLEKSNLPLDHRSGCSPGGRASFREDLRVPTRRFHHRVSSTLFPIFPPAVRLD